MTNILVTDEFSSESLTFLSTQIDCQIKHARSYQPSTIELKDCHVLLTRSKTRVHQELLSCAPQLKWIGTATSGLDHIDTDECKKKNITIFNPVEANATSAAEHAFSLILSMAKNTITANFQVRQQLWKTNLPRGFELFQKNLCIIGLGRVGSRVARMGNAFFMNVSAYDPYKTDDYFAKHQVTRCGLSEALSNADILTLHTPLTQETNNMLNRKNLSLCSPHCIIINTSRGHCLNQNDLTEFLDKKQIGGAALDVFQKEPPPEGSPLFSCKNTLLTPHIGAHTHQAFQRASMEVARWVVQQHSESCP